MTSPIPAPIPNETAPAEPLSEPERLPEENARLRAEIERLQAQIAQQAAHYDLLSEAERELARLAERDALLRRAVELGQEKLGFERLSFWLVEPGTQNLRGSFGVDERGRIRDERMNILENYLESFLAVYQAAPTEVIFQRQADLLNDHIEKVGRGDRVSAALWDGEAVLGVLSADNLLTNRPMTPADATVARLYAATVASLYTRLCDQETLRKSRQEFQTLLEHSPDVICRLDRNLRYLYVSPAVQNASDWKPEDFLGKTDRELRLDGALLEGWEAALRAVFETGKPGRFEGESESLIAPEFGSDGAVETVLVIARDVRERRWAEQALQESEQRFRTVVEGLGEGILIADLEDRILYSNRRMTEITGYTRQEMSGQFAYVLFGVPEQRETWKERNRRRLEGIEETYLVQLHRKGGALFWAEITGTPFRNAQGEVIGTLGAISDVTERVEAVHSLRLSEDWRGLLLSSVPLTLYTAHSFWSETVFWISDNVRQMTGFAPERFYEPKFFAERIHPDDLPGIHAPFPSEGKISAISREYRWRCADGSYRWFSDRALPRFSEEGEPLEVVGIWMDITEQKRSAQILKAHHGDIETLNALFEAINRATDAAQIYQALAHCLERASRLQAGCLWSCELAQNALRLEASWGVFAAEPPDSPDSIEVALSDLCPGATLPLLYPILTSVAEGRAPIHPLHQRLLAANGGAGVTQLCLPLGLGAGAQGALTLFSALPEEFTPERIAFFSLLGHQVGIALEKARLHADTEAHEQRLQRLSRQLLEVQEAERKRLAQEFHDEFGQLLTGLKIQLDRSVRLSGDKGRDATDAAQRAVEELIERARRLSYTLHPPMLDDQGLLPTLHWHLQRYMEQTGIQVHWTAGLPAERLRSDSEIAAYRIVQEALTNIARHAGVSEATLKLWEDASELHIEIRDEGVGFSVSEETPDRPTQGVTGMIERAALVGGKTVLVSEPGEGTSVLVTLPWKGEAAV